MRLNYNYESFSRWVKHLSVLITNLSSESNYNTFNLRSHIVNFLLPRKRHPFQGFYQGLYNRKTDACIITLQKVDDIVHENVLSAPVKKWPNTKYCFW